MTTFLLGMAGGAAAEVVSLLKLWRQGDREQVAADVRSPVYIGLVFALLLLSGLVALLLDPAAPLTAFVEGIGAEAFIRRATEAARAGRSVPAGPEVERQAVLARMLQ